MSKTYDDHIQKYKTQMREAFKNFKATFTDLNLVQILDWRNENGRIQVDSPAAAAGAAGTRGGVVP